MLWKIKSKLQKHIDYLPPNISYNIYYLLQRYFGGLRYIAPVNHFKAAIQLWNKIINTGRMGEDRVFFEVGTGAIPIVPVAFWLMGAKETITIDINPYLREILIVELVKYIRNNQEIIEDLFLSLLNKDRLEELVGLDDKKLTANKILELCEIRYIAPGNAACTGLDNNSIDYHTSYSVFEHIPNAALFDILTEGKRIVKENGLFIHRIDYSDHFSHTDKSISSINFLQYSDLEWSKYADNRFMYMNRMRHSDFIDLFNSTGHQILQCDTFTDNEVVKILESGNLEIDDKFKNKTNEDLSITGAWIVSQNSNNNN